MSPVVVTYLVYVPLTVGLTYWVARTLSRNGALFLREVFAGDERMAGAVNHLLVVGFWLINLGYVALALRTGADVPDARTAIETLATKVGGVLLVAGRDALPQPVRPVAHASPLAPRRRPGAARAAGRTHPVGTGRLPARPAPAPGGLRWARWGG